MTKFRLSKSLDNEPSFLDSVGMKVSEGQRYHYFTTLRPQKIGAYSGWLCRCDCGVERAVYTNKLTSGKYKSCGCKKKQLMSEASTRHGHTKNGIPPEYRVWRGIKTRCLNPKTRHYKDYGGRGITVHEEWKKDFAAFYDYVGPRPTSAHTIDRIDNSRGYEPGNVRWATAHEQGANKRSNHLIEVDGRTMTIATASRLTGIRYGTLWYRVMNGLPIKG